MAGWMHTGDIVRFDENGFLFLVGHKADILSYRLSKIYPTLLEQVLIDTKEVQDACVVGIPDQLEGELLAAVIVKKPNSLLTKNYLIKLIESKYTSPVNGLKSKKKPLNLIRISDNFSDEQHLRGGVYFVPAMPRSNSGKLLRNNVRKIAIEVRENLNREYTKK